MNQQKILFSIVTKYFEPRYSQEKQNITIFKMDSKGYQANAPAPDPYGQPPSYEQASYPPPSQAYPPMGQAYPPPSQTYPPQSQGM